MSWIETLVSVPRRPRPPFSGLYAKFLFLTLVIDGFPFILIVKIIGQK
jgi:hypothetical protein